MQVASHGHFQRLARRIAPKLQFLANCKSERVEPTNNTWSKLGLHIAHVLDSSSALASLSNHPYFDTSSCPGKLSLFHIKILWKEGFHLGCLLLAQSSAYPTSPDSKLHSSGTFQGTSSPALQGGTRRFDSIPYFIILYIPTFW
jgi:hypothetical protein